MLALTLARAVTWAGAVLVFAGVIALLPKLLRVIGTWVDFFRDAAKVGTIDALAAGQTTIQEGLAALLEEVKFAQRQSDDIDDIKMLMQALPARLDAAAIANTVSAFKAHVAACPTPSFAGTTSVDGFGTFQWANDAWYELHGLDYAEAANGQYWACIAPEHRDRVKAASDHAAANLEEFSVTYDSINLKTGVRSQVRVRSWPLIPSSYRPGDDILFLGAIRIIGHREH